MVLGQGLPVTLPPVGQMTRNFACMGLLWVITEFGSSQGHVTSTEATPVYYACSTGCPKIKSALGYLTIVSTSKLPGAL